MRNNITQAEKIIQSVVTRKRWKGNQRHTWRRVSLTNSAKHNNIIYYDHARKCHSSYQANYYVIRTEHGSIFKAQFLVF